MFINYSSGSGPWLCRSLWAFCWISVFWTWRSFVLFLLTRWTAFVETWRTKWLFAWWVFCWKRSFQLLFWTFRLVFWYCCSFWTRQGCRQVWLDDGRFCWVYCKFGCCFHRVLNVLEGILIGIWGWLMWELSCWLSCLLLQVWTCGCCNFVLGIGLGLGRFLCIGFSFISFFRVGLYWVEEMGGEVNGGIDLIWWLGSARKMVGLGFVLDWWVEIIRMM